MSVLNPTTFKKVQPLLFRQEHLRSQNLFQNNKCYNFKRGLYLFGTNKLILKNVHPYKQWKDLQFNNYVDTI